MQSVRYTVKDIDGDYAVLTSNGVDENRVARALLPFETDVGTVLIYENFSYDITD